MIVDIVIERDRCRHWLLHLAELLQTALKAKVRFEFAEPNPPVGAALKSILSFEAKLLRLYRQCGANVLDLHNLEQKSADADAGDWTIDLTASGIPSRSGDLLRVLYDGAPGEDVLCAGLLTRGTPLIEILDPAKGHVVARGTASLEAAVGLGGAMEAVYSRLAMLIVRVLSGTTETYAPREALISPCVSSKTAVVEMLRQSAQTVIRFLYSLGFYASHWRVGWRFCEDGTVAERQDLYGDAWNILKSPHDHFYADPFSFEKDGKYFLFFEDLDHATQKGVISVVEVTPDGPRGAARCVLEEPWHLSYPFVFERDGDIWMIPESSANRNVSLYRAVQFPDRWEHHSVLLENIEAADATLAEYQNKLWMFVVVRNGLGGYSDTLNIYYADELCGQWLPHERNPVLVDDRSARPGGRMYMDGENLWRPVQDCRNGYGSGLGLAKVDTLSPTEFSQSVQTVIYPNHRWPGRKLHTLNKINHLEVIDGCTYHPKSRYLAKLFYKYYFPK